MEIKGKIAIVTGGASGIGLCITKKFLAFGVKVLVLFDLDNVSTRSTFDELKRAYGERVEFYPCDVTKSEQFAKNLDKIIVSYKTIDVLVNNAGVGQESKAELMIDVNFKAVILGSYAFIGKIGKHKGGRGGVIVNIASLLGLVNVELPTYCATKHGVVSFTRTMKESYGTTNVRVVAICPGLTNTPMIPNSKDEQIDFLKDVKKRVHTGTSQSPENVASAVLSIIEQGKPGDVWISEADLPPRPVEEVSSYQFPEEKCLKIIQI